MRGVLDTAQAFDKATISRYLIRSSIQNGLDVERLHAAEMQCGGYNLGYCCSSSNLWCEQCGNNFLWSGVDRDIQDHIHDLLWLPRATAVSRKSPGTLESALALLERVLRRQKPLGQLTLDDFSEEEEAVLAHTVERARDRLVTIIFFDGHVRKMGFCSRGLRLGDVISLASLAELYSRAELPQVAIEIREVSQVRRCPSCGPEALISRWIKRSEAEHNGSMPWLTGVLLGYPVWTTIARYRGGCTTLSSTRTISLSQHVSKTKRRAPCQPAYS